MGSGQWAVGQWASGLLISSGQWEVGSGKWEVGSGQWASGLLISSGQWAVGQWAFDFRVGSGQWAVGSGRPGMGYNNRRRRQNEHPKSMEVNTADFTQLNNQQMFSGCWF